MFASPSRHLPLELHRPIVERISDRADLYTLTLVCRALQFEADRILFRRISVRKSSSETVRRYKALIALAPRIGTHIRELEVVRYGETSSLYAMIRLLRAVLLSAPNLQRLHAVYKWGDSDWPLEIPGGLMVRGMELNQLQYFSCPWVIDHDVISFFERHPNLHDLVVFLPWGEYPISGTALPRLKYLSAWRNTATRLLPGRPVTHFQVNVWDRSHWDAEFSAALLSTSVPLRALQVPSFRWGPHLNNLLPLFSNLHYLGICQLNGEREANDWRLALASFERLEGLEILVWEQREAPAQCILLVSLSTACSSLRRVRVRLPGLSDDREWVLTDRGWTLVREGFRSGDDAFWREF